MSNKDQVKGHIKEVTGTIKEVTGKPIKFVGLEVPEELLAQPEDLRRAYLAAVQRFIDRLEEVCRNNRVERVPIDTSRDLAEVLIDYLNHRSRLNRGR